MLPRLPRVEPPRPDDHRLALRPVEWRECDVLTLHAAAKHRKLAAHLLGHGSVTRCRTADTICVKQRVVEHLRVRRKRVLDLQLLRLRRFAGSSYICAVDALRRWFFCGEPLVGTGVDTLPQCLDEAHARLAHALAAHCAHGLFQRHLCFCLVLAVNRHLEVVECLLAQVGDLDLTLRLSHYLARVIPQLTLPLQADLELVERELFLLARLHGHLAVHLVKGRDLAPALAATLFHGHNAHQQLGQLIFRPWRQVLLAPVPLVAIRPIFALLDNPPRVALANLSHCLLV
mmetsp:Transcript_74727/g.148539  ORF Transcript_74727/g.148539 Transcript_74727/m.148539 type:complete len:288 (-) Transcript_74727:33-896(-)